MTVDLPVIGKASGWSIDTRTLAADDVFFALRGPTHDGHDHVSDAFARGAVGAVVEHTVTAAGKQWVVPDSLAALQQVARDARVAWGGQVIGVTGSAGKTTTKDVIAHLLGVALPTGKTVGNFNNHFGLPLSILRLPDGCRAAVLEMGMNHAGEIRALAAIARPDMGVVTNVGYAHVEFFDSIEGIAAAKRELIEALPDTGTAVLNHDDALVSAMRGAHRGAVITFGIGEGADVHAEHVEMTPHGARFQCCGATFETPLSGAHGVRNTLAGIAVAHAFGIPASRLKDAVRTIPTGKMRGEQSVVNGVTIINDAYNSNPEAVRSMLDVLAAVDASRRIAVLGEMLELGASSDELHRSTGRYAGQKKIDLVIGIRGNALGIIEEAAHSGVPETLFFDDARSAGEALARILRPGDAVLFKGSRGVQVELAIAPLLEKR
jgi:UDP-N-acetylmuramoyl-tripeptide--D-alanyl-D-alanine ligase